MNRKLLVAIVSGVLAAPMAAQVQADEMEVEPHSHPAAYEHEHAMEDGSMSPLHAHEHESHPHSELHGHSATVYGSLRYAVEMSDDGVSGSSTGFGIGKNYGSRFGIKGSVGAGAGLTAGFQLERNLDGGLTERFHNVYLSGAYGTLTLGRQGSGYYGATTWDGAAHLGGATDVADKVAGASIASSLGGPFDFKVFAGDGGAGEGADHIEVSGSLAAGPVSLGVGYMEDVDGGERLGGTVSGTAANITLLMGYEAAQDIECVAATPVSVAHTPATTPVGHDVTAATTAQICDEDRYGFTLSYLVGAGPGGGNAYVQYGQRDSGDATAMKRDIDYWTLGYSHYVSEAVTVNLVHRTKDAYNADHKAQLRDRTSAVVLKVDF